MGNPNREKPQEPTDSEQNHYGAEYNDVRLRGNDLELYLRQPAVTTGKLSVSVCVCHWEKLRVFSCATHKLV